MYVNSFFAVSASASRSPSLLIEIVHRQHAMEVIVPWLPNQFQCWLQLCLNLAHSSTSKPIHSAHSAQLTNEIPLPLVSCLSSVWTRCRTWRSSRSRICHCNILSAYFSLPLLARSRRSKNIFQFVPTAAHSESSRARSRPDANGIVHKMNTLAMPTSRIRNSGVTPAASDSSAPQNNRHESPCSLTFSNLGLQHYKLQAITMVTFLKGRFCACSICVFTIHNVDKLAAAAQCDGR